MFGLNVFLFHFSDSVCDWSLILYFDFRFSPFVEHVPFDCMAKNWQKLEYLQLGGFPSVTNISTQFWSLPNLNTAFLEICNFDSFNFDLETFPEFTDSLVATSLSLNEKICFGSIFIDDTKYDGFGYLEKTNFTSMDVDNYPLLQFIEKLNPCNMPCNDGRSQCLNSVYQDGFCTENCNIPACDFDGGDCFQLCECRDYDLWDNEICDDACNTTRCHYDFGECSESIYYGNTTCFDRNGTVCYNEWTSDQFCDINCNVTECDFDDSQCTGCWGQCLWLYSFVISTLGNEYEPYELVTLDEICDNWDTLQGFMSNIDQGEQGFLNCSQGFEVFDLNSNGYIGMFEIISNVKDTFGITSYTHSTEKLQQIDCSICLTNSSLYYV